MSGRWLLFTVVMIAGLLFAAGTQSYAAFSLSLQEKDQMNKDMPADTGMTHQNQSGMQSHGDMKAMMGEMRDSMMNIQKTGDPDQDFAAMMIQHHKGAVRMSEEEVNKGKDQKIISMAEKVIKDQTNEIQDLQKFVKTDQSQTGMRTGQMNDTSMQKRKDMQDMTGSSQQKMMDKMQNMEMTGNQDEDYASMMVIHHQHAIDMANEYLDKGKDSELIKMAKKMISENESQIKDLEDWKMNKTK
ncbi:MAG: DUF305 domain-containing protein [Ignavibacteria bacterium]|jgi:uncharacterized protein (DUF305 family)|nr:DUF305 domain-containing protein [Ignavibacteria bacterium]MCU7511318.1 DUF305 domain-containing protein [Ignavibacteria bacterium]MCU7525805.1 DUF305 domain-containing protein [Ignavibacteria bacterium]